MRITVAIDQTKLRRLQRRMRQFSPRVRKRILRKAVAKASTPVAREMRKRAPKQTGRLRKAIKRSKAITRRENVFMLVGPEKIPEPYAHLVTGGTQPHDIPTPTGGVIHHPGSQPNPFPEVALNAVRPKVQRTLEVSIRDGILKEANRK